MLHLILFVEVWSHFMKEHNEVDVSHKLQSSHAASRFDVLYNSGYVIS